MCSNAPIGKKKGKIQNAQQCAHWKKNEKNSKCATMCPLEKKRENIKMQSNVPIGKSGKCKMRSNVPIGKKNQRNSKCATMCQFKMRSNVPNKNLQQCAHWKR